MTAKAQRHQEEVARVSLRLHGLNSIRIGGVLFEWFYPSSFQTPFFIEKDHTLRHGFNAEARVHRFTAGGAQRSGPRRILKQRLYCADQH